MKPTIRRAEDDDAIYFAVNLRSADARELHTAHPDKSIEAVLRDAIQKGEAYTLRFGTDSPCVLFGIVKYTSLIGIIWMVATPRIDGHALSILREASSWIDSWKAKYGVLTNYMEVRNTLHLRWLTVLGATFRRYCNRNGVEVVLFTF